MLVIKHCGIVNIILNWSNLLLFSLLLYDVHGSELVSYLIFVYLWVPFKPESCREIIVSYGLNMDYGENTSMQFYNFASHTTASWRWQWRLSYADTPTRYIKHVDSDWHLILGMRKKSNCCSLAPLSSCEIMVPSINTEWWRTINASFQFFRRHQSERIYGQQQQQQ